MEIQWPLVMYTLLGGLGTGTMVCVAIAEWKSRLARTCLPAAVTALVAMVLGGISSILHLGHAERGVNLLGNVGSGLSQEVFGIGFAGLATLLYVWFAWRGSSTQTRKTLAVIAGVISFVEAFLFGKAYVLPARPGWDSWLLPLLYMASAGVLGLFTFSIWAAVRKEEQERSLVNRIALAAIAVEAVLLATWVGFLTSVPEVSVARLLGGDLAIYFWLGAVVIGLIVPFALTAWFQFSKSKVALSWLGVVVIGLMCAGIGGITLRSMMYMMGSPVALFH